MSWEHSVTYVSGMDNILFGGAKRNRTADLLNAIQALSQLSYGPMPAPAIEPRRPIGKPSPWRRGMPFDIRSPLPPRKTPPVCSAIFCYVDPRVAAVPFDGRYRFRGGDRT